MNAEDYEHGMDAQWRQAEIGARTDLYDSVQDARSEARYEETESDVMTEHAEAARLTP